MSGRLLKCYGTCGQKYPKDVLQKIKNKNYCPDCYQIKLKNDEEREKLYNQIEEIFNISFPTGLILRQIKEFKEERGYSYKNIRFALDYIVRIKKIKLQLQYGIALVPHYYDEMISYYKDLNEKRQNTVIKKSNIVHIKMKPFIQENTYRNKKLINMERLLDTK